MKEMASAGQAGRMVMGYDSYYWCLSVVIKNRRNIVTPGFCHEEKSKCLVIATGHSKQFA